MNSRSNIFYFSIVTAFSVAATLILELADILMDAGALLVALFGAAPAAIVMGVCELVGYDVSRLSTEMTVTSSFIAAILYYSLLLYVPLRIMPKMSIYVITAVIHLLIGVSIVFYALFQWQR